MTQLAFRFALPEALEAKEGAGPLFMVTPQVDLGDGLAGALNEATGGALARAVTAADVKGGWGEARAFFALPGAPRGKVILVVADPQKAKGDDAYLMLGGKMAAQLGKVTDASIVVDGLEPEQCADMLAGMALGAYRFDRYKSAPDMGADDDAPPPGSCDITVYLTDPGPTERAYSEAEAVTSGALLARDLVNEPPNVLGPEEFAAVAEALADLGVEVSVLDEEAMADLGMNALLGVSQGSTRPPRMAIMQWKGGSDDTKPLAVVGKGVVFDSGGISIKPAGGMEDMKGDMGGAACVVGLMHALASRKAKTNVVGVIGLVENMPDGNAQRPGDIVTSMAGKTIEIVNTDAEGRLVLADALHHTMKTFEPVAMIDLATLTGAILVALGNEHAGLFSNNDELAEDLAKAGVKTGEKVWRLPLAPAYDKLLESRFADMKNVGGRYAGSITAAQFLQRFVGDTPWAHLDVAGTAMAGAKSPINPTFGSGWGVRLLDRFIRDRYENG